MQPPLELVLGTGNRKKVVEIRDLFQNWPVKLLSLDEFPNAAVVEETGDSFAANAELKAVDQARALKRWVLAEDSGLSVAALDGRPGIYSARFAGPTATDADNNRHLMQQLQGVPQEKRGAWYTCHACLASPDGEVVLRAEACCRGRIILEPRGIQGFGYDPWFEIPEYHLTFAELGLHVKSILSHRARAIRTLQSGMRNLFGLAID